MIQRRRQPNPDHQHEPRTPCPTCDVWHGPGPVGRLAKQRAASIGAEQVGYMMQPPDLRGIHAGTDPRTEARRASKRRWQASYRGGGVA